MFIFIQLNGSKVHKRSNMFLPRKIQNRYPCTTTYHRDTNIVILMHVNICDTSQTRSNICYRNMHNTVIILHIIVPRRIIISSKLFQQFISAYYIA